MKSGLQQIVGDEQMPKTVAPVVYIYQLKIIPKA